jgi:thioredoxin reductase (NADPH)
MLNKLIIIGSGPAGLTAAIYAARAQLNPLLFEGVKPGGQLMGTSMVENWPGEIAILGPELMMKMRTQAKNLGTEFKSEQILNVIKKTDQSGNYFDVKTNKNSYQAKAVIIATGSTPRRLECLGEEKLWGKGVTTCAVCDGAFYKDKPVVIIGGGDTAMEDASFMTKFTKNITVIHILDKLTASVAMQERVIHNPDIKIIYNSTVVEFIGDTHLNSVKYKNMQTGLETVIPAKAAFLAIGLTPNTSFLPPELHKTDYGHIIVECDKAKTNIEGLFACGDVTDAVYRQAIVAAGTGCKAALDAEKYLSSINL